MERMPTRTLLEEEAWLGASDPALPEHPTTKAREAAATIARRDELSNMR
jgi:hypothetical protein